MASLAPDNDKGGVLPRRRLHRLLDLLGQS